MTTTSTLISGWSLTNHSTNQHLTKLRNKAEAREYLGFQLATYSEFPHVRLPLYLHPRFIINTKRVWSSACYGLLRNILNTELQHKHTVCTEWVCLFITLYACIWEVPGSNRVAFLSYPTKFKIIPQTVHYLLLPSSFKLINVPPTSHNLIHWQRISINRKIIRK